MSFHPNDIARRTRLSSYGLTIGFFLLLARLEGILPALESAHAIAEVMRRAPLLPPEQILLVNLSGRGDKDLDSVVRALQARGVE